MAQREREKNNATNVQPAVEKNVIVLSICLCAETLFKARQMLLREIKYTSY